MYLALYCAQCQVDRDEPHRVPALEELSLEGKTRVNEPLAVTGCQRSLLWLPSSAVQTLLDKLVYFHNFTHYSDIS